MELLVVMAIIVIIAGISVPVIRSMLTDTRQTAAADMVRARLADARAHAMDEGRPWKLGFIPGTGVFQLAPEDSTDWEGQQQDPIARPDLFRDELPPEIIFASSAQAIQGQSGASSGGGAWETIAIFMPAGNAREDSAVYFGKGGFWPMRAEIRGLTGSVDIQIADPNGATP